VHTLLLQSARLVQVGKHRSSRRELCILTFIFIVKILLSSVRRTYVVKVCVYVCVCVRGIHSHWCGLVTALPPGVTKYMNLQMS
jgi:hypothetical protein